MRFTAIKSLFILAIFFHQGLPPVHSSDDGEDHRLQVSRTMVPLEEDEQAFPEGERLLQQSGESIRIDPEGRPAGCLRSYNTRLYLTSLIKTALPPSLLATAATIMCKIAEYHESPYMLAQNPFVVASWPKFFMPTEMTTQTLSGLRAALGNGQYTGLTLEFWDDFHIVLAFSPVALPLITETMKHCHRVLNPALMGEDRTLNQMRTIYVAKSIGGALALSGGIVYAVINYNWLNNLLTYYGAKVIERCTVGQAISIYNQTIQEYPYWVIVTTKNVVKCSIEELQNMVSKSTLYNPWSYCETSYMTINSFQAIAFTAPIIAFMLNFIYWIVML